MSFVPTLRENLRDISNILDWIHINYKKERTACDILLHKVKFNSKEAHILIK